MFGKLKHYIHNVLVGADQEANIVLGGHPDETVSSRSQRAADRGNPVGKALTGFLHLFQRDHGHKAEEGDLRRAEQVEQIEQDALKNRK